ncbi:MAG: epoxyqueuosine reductase [Firmicutes bacterium]|nr:epoxyqueuosine reductase [Bacillota bacterium]
MKERIREYVLGMGVDGVGFASADDYQSPRSPRIETIFPEVKSIVVMAYKELSSCNSDNMQIAMNGRLDLMEFSRSCNYRLARFLEKEFNAMAMTVPISYPLDMSQKTMGSVGDVSLRHAAVAAGLGVLGRHNLVIHPQFGTRVLFSAVLSDQSLSSDPLVMNELCIQCNICVDSCPVGALDEEGKTDILKCIRKTQPYGIGSHIQFWNRFVDLSPEEKKKLFKDDHYWRLYQSAFIGLQYFCFNCEKTCPVGK